MKEINIDEVIINLQNKIGLPPNFFKDLLEEEDWSFVIKLHAFIEAIVTSLLVFHFNEKKLSIIFSRLELSNKTTGKLAFLKESGLIGEEYIKYIYNLSELRNKLVHNVKNCNIDLVKYVAYLDKQQLKNFAKFMRPLESQIRKFAKLDIDEILIKESEINKLIDFAKAEPKLHIWVGAYSLLTSISEMFYYSDFLQSIKAKELSDEDRKIFE